MNTGIMMQQLIDYAQLGFFGFLALVFIIVWWARK